MIIPDRSQLVSGQPGHAGDSALIAQIIGGHVDTNACNPSVYSDCITSNLDTQYIMAVAQGTPTTYYTDSDWDYWITDVANFHYWITEPCQCILH